MKNFLVIGLVVVVLGILALVVPIPRTENHDLRAGSFSMGIQTHHDEKLPPYVGAVMIVAGIGLIAAQKFKG
jgi:hypothetical protein